MILNTPKPSVGGGFSEADIRFIKNYHKKSYPASSANKDSLFDCGRRQAPLKTFLEVGRGDYSFCKQCSKIRKEMLESQANELISQVMEINEHTEAISG